jgi:hypothetical protein
VQLEPLAQVTQALPSAPQASLSLPAVQKLSKQQPPARPPSLQGEWPLPQACSQWWVARLHEVPPGQSAAAAQPHVPSGAQAVPV